MQTLNILLCKCDIHALADCPCALAVGDKRVAGVGPVVAGAQRFPCQGHPPPPIPYTRNKQDGRRKQESEIHLQRNDSKTPC